MFQEGGFGEYIIDSLQIFIMTEKLNHLRALMLKSASMQAKQKCTNCCQIFTPLICIIFTYLIKVIAGDQLPVGQITTVAVPVLANYPNYLFKNMNYSGGLVQANTPICWYLLHYENQEDMNFLGHNDGLGKKSGLLSKVLQTNNVNHAADPSNLNRQQKFSMPYFNITSNNTNAELYSILKLVDRTPYNKSNKTSKRIVQTIPEGAFEVHRINSTFLNVTIQNNDVRELFYRNINGRNMLVAYSPDKQSQNYLFSTSQGYFAAMDLISSTFIGQKPGLRSVSGYLDMPPNPYQGSFADVIINLTASTLFSISLSLLLPVFMYAVVLEKEEKLIEMMKMNGCSISIYWLSVFIFDFILTVITFTVFILAGVLLLRNNFFLETGADIFIVVLLGWAVSQIGVAVFFQTFVATARSANIIGYLLSIWTSLISTTLNLGVYPYPKPMNLAILTYPPFGFGRIFYMMLSQCSNVSCYSSLSAMPSELIYAIVCLYVVGLLMFILGVYFYQILPKQIGVARPWYYPVQGFINRQPQLERSEVDLLDGEELDVESLKEQELAIQSDPSDLNSLHCKALKKIYPSVGNKPQQLAVNSFSLVIKNGQIFGLLGPNGAGKTTLLSMLTGIYQSNKGDAWIAGHNIKTEMPTIHTLIGVCPQFDLLWPELSIEDHLLFYARLKGVQRAEEDEKVNIALAQVNLQDKKQKLANELSGGMKRRLSIAISMVGQPKIIFLDEPTTGLDPDNRRQIWEIISKCKMNRSILLTTHSMEEADVLCTRIGIISSGVLRTVGNQITLKNLYVGGYYLQIGLNADCNQNHIQNMHSFLSEIFEQKNLRRTFKTNFIFEVVLGQNKMSNVFEAVENNKKRLCIETWSISQPRLQEVFMKVVSKYGYLTDDD